jgi:hypothetical protein
MGPSEQFDASIVREKVTGLTSMGGITDSSNESPPATIMALIADEAISDEQIDLYARQIAYQNGRTGLLRIRRSQVELVEYIPSSTDKEAIGQKQESPDSLNNDELTVLLADQVGCAKQGGDCKSLSENNLREAFEGLSRRVETILFHSDETCRSMMAAILRNCATAVVFASTSADGIVSAYRNIKWLTGEVGFDREISLFVTDADAQNVGVVHDKLASTARQYLNIELPYAEYPQPGGHVERRQLAVGSFDEAMHKELNTILNCNNENEAKVPPVDLAINAGWAMDSANETGGKAGELMKEILDFSLGADRQGNQAVTAGIVTYCPIPISQFPEDEGLLCGMLSDSISLWLKDIPSAIALPGDGSEEAVRVLVDGRGRMYVFAACLDIRGIAGRICTARNQLANRVKEIAGRYPQLKIDYSLAPEAIVVMPENLLKFFEAEELSIDFPVHLKRLFFLDDGRKKSLLVI